MLCMDSGQMASVGLNLSSITFSLNGPGPVCLSLSLLVCKVGTRTLPCMTVVNMRMSEAPSTVPCTGEGPVNENYNNIITVNKAVVHTQVKAQLLSLCRTRESESPWNLEVLTEGLSSLEHSFLNS